MVTNNDEGADEDSLTKDIESINRSVSRQTLWAILFLLLMALLLATSFISISKAVNATNTLLAIEPVNRAEVMLANIEKTTLSVKQQYAKHLSKMESGDVYFIHSTYSSLYHTAQEGEEAFADFLKHHQKSVYQIASKVRGSGEWYYHHNNQIKHYINDIDKRKTQMARHIEEEINGE